MIKYPMHSPGEGAILLSGLGLSEGSAAVSQALLLNAVLSRGLCCLLPLELLSCFHVLAVLGVFFSLLLSLVDFYTSDTKCVLPQCSMETNVALSL